jgi:Ca-activated chloride channel family protein
MSFEWPLALVALLLVPVAIAAYLLGERRRARMAARFAAPALFPNVVGRRPGRLRHLPVAILLVALTAMLVGVARPHATVSVQREEATVVLAMDVSRSMVATDVRPSRLVAAQAAARRFLRRVPETFRVGVVAFATRAQVAAPPTEDRGVAHSAINGLRPGEGTALGEAIALAVNAARPARVRPEDRPPASILLISDGAQTQGNVTPAAAAQRARRRGVPVYTVALGTDQGVVERELPGGFTERVRVPPDPETLENIARTTGGEFFAAPDDEQLSRVYEELGSRLGRRPKRAEITVAFAGAGALLLLAGGALSALLFRRVPA